MHTVILLQHDLPVAAASLPSLSAVGAAAATLLGLFCASSARCLSTYSVSITACSRIILASGDRAVGVVWASLLPPSSAAWAARAPARCPVDSVGPHRASGRR